jgi:hypothetical protein
MSSAATIHHTDGSTTELYTAQPIEFRRQNADRHPRTIHNINIIIVIITSLSGWLSYGLDDRTSISGRSRQRLLLFITYDQTGTGAHPVYTMGTMGPFPGGKAAGPRR